MPYAKLDDPQSLNLYDYVRGNPLASVDPDGHWFEDIDAMDAMSIPLAAIFYGQTLVAQDARQGLSQAQEQELESRAQQQNTVTASAKGSSVTYTYPDGSKIVLTGDHPFRDNNPGDLKSGHGSIGRDGKFAIYSSLDAGVNALNATLTGKYANSTIIDTMTAFAPKRDGNDPVKYANTLATAVGVPVTTKISALSSAQLMTFQYNIAIAEGYNAAGNTASYVAPPQ